MAHADHLAGFALAAVGRAVRLLVLADAGQAAPEIHGHAAVVGVAHHLLELAVADHLPVLTAELELVAVVVDGPGTIRLHQHTELHLGDQFVQRGAARLQIDVGHAVDGRAVPGRGAKVRHARQPAALLRFKRAQAALQHAVLDQQFARCGVAAIVKGIAGQLIRPARIEAHVHQGRPVLQPAEILRLDEAPAGVIAFIAQDAIEFQRVADGLVNLQHHLVRHQDQVHVAAGAIGRLQQLQRFVRDALRLTLPALRLEGFAAKLAGVRPGARLRLHALRGGRAERDVHHVKVLTDVGAVRGEIRQLRLHRHGARAAVHQQLRALHGAAGAMQAVLDLRQRRLCQRLAARALILPLRRRALRGREAMHLVRAGGARGGQRPLEAALQALGAQIGGRGKTKMPVHQHFAHGAGVERALVLFWLVIAHAAHRRGLAGVAQAGPIRRLAGVAQCAFREADFLFEHGESRVWGRGLPSPKRAEF